MPAFAGFAEGFLDVWLIEILLTFLCRITMNSFSPLNEFCFVPWTERVVPLIHSLTFTPKHHH